MGLSAGYSRHRANFYIANDRPKKLWLRPLAANAKQLLRAVQVPQEFRPVLVAAASGTLPIDSPQMDSLLDVFRKGPHPRDSNTRYRIGPVLALIAMALLAGKREIAEIARLGRQTHHCRPAALPASTRPRYCEKGGDYLVQIKANQSNLFKTCPWSGSVEEHPLFVQTQSGHGRVEVRRLHPFAVEPLAVDFPFARTLIALRSERTVKKSGLSTSESRFYLSSVPPQQYRAEQWMELICGHWAGVEIRNHWRRDVWMGEEGSLSRNPNLLANLALIRSALLQVICEHLQDQSLPEFQESLESNPGRCRALVAKS